MPTATNPQTGEKVALIGGQWVPVQGTATNPKTGERLALANGSWQPIEGYGNPSQEQPEQRSMMGEVGRQAGLTGRAVAGGLAQAVEPFTEPVRYMMNAALPGNPIGNIEAATDEVLTSAGVPEPQNSVERGVQSVGRFATSVGAGTGISRGVEKALGITQPAAQAAAPSTDKLKEMANAAYQAADDAGVVLSPASFGPTVGKIASRVKEAGIDPTLHPKATAALKRLTDATKAPLKLQEAETLRRVVKGAAKSIEPDERRIAQIMASTLDDYMLNLRTSDVLAGDAKGASSALGSARDLWSRMSKSETVEELVERAGVRASQFSGSGFENALRTEFRTLVLNPKRLRMFNKAEQEALKKVASGGPVENALRMLGKAAPTGIVSSALGSGGGYAMGGPLGAVAVPAVGLAARKGATAMTSNNAQKAAELMRRGGPAAAQGIPPELLSWIVGGAIGAPGSAQN